jgi:hypothetical protein
MTTALEGGEGSASHPGRSLPPGENRYPLYLRLGGSKGRSGQVRKISPPPGFDPRTAQPVASRYTDCATRPTNYKKEVQNFFAYHQATVRLPPFEKHRYKRVIPTHQQTTLLHREIHVRIVWFPSFLSV